MPKKILIVDDDEGFQELLKIRLSRLSYEVITASDGDVGVKFAREYKPDLILMDAVMPILSGYMAVKQLRADPITRNIPVIILSAREKLEELFHAEGVQDFIRKPFETEELVKKVKTYLND